MQLLWWFVAGASMLFNDIPAVGARRTQTASSTSSSSSSSPSSFPANGYLFTRLRTEDATSTNVHRNHHRHNQHHQNQNQHQQRGFFISQPRSKLKPSSSSSSRMRVVSNGGGGGGGSAKEAKGRRPFTVAKDKKPNIVLIVTDDQDVELRSMDYMPKALRILRDGGTHFDNSFVTTPMCCPSRSSMLTGMYVHNHHVFTNNDNCSSAYWQQTHETRTFATYLTNVGYRTGFFGKYLNEYNGTYIPPGWREWAGLIRNSRFYNYSINVNGRKIKHGDDYHKDYYPDLITNDSISFLKQSKLLFVNKPVMMVLSYPSPHGPEDAAPQYQKLFPNVTTHRTPSWNYAPNADKQWILRHTNKMEDIHIKFTDALHRKRLQTLQSVDDAIERLYNALLEIGELNNTYIFYTSDHGYHLGQFGLIKGKAMPFDFDIRVPFYLRGPNVPSGVSVSNIVLNLDLAPSFLDIAGVEVPEHMDGRSVMSLVAEANVLSSSRRRYFSREILKVPSWRDTFLLESAGRQTADSEKKRVPSKTVSELPVTAPSHFEQTEGMTKEERIAYICQSHEFRSPCVNSQRWECIHNGVRWRLQKCRSGHHGRRSFKSNCICPDASVKTTLPTPLDLTERRRQRAFLRDHVGKDFKPHFIGSRGRRSSSDNFDLASVYQLYDVLNLKYDYPDLDVLDGNNATHKLRHSGDHRIDTRSTKGYPMLHRGCRLTPNNIVNCSDKIYSDLPTWRENKNYIDGQIKLLKVKLTELKGIRKHLKKKRPGEGYVAESEESFDDLDYDMGNNNNNDDDDDEESDLHGDLDDADDECICGNTPFGKRYSRRRGNRRQVFREDRRRLKEERMRRRQEKLKKQERKNRRIAKYENYTCNIEKMNCFVHDNEHWKTPPLWTDGKFCFCQNSNNNTYWCLRTINATHNFLFCEFITGFLSFYDMTRDQFQLHNRVNEVPIDILNQLYYQLKKMKNCSGAQECNVRSRLRGSRTFNAMATPAMTRFPMPTDAAHRGRGRVLDDSYYGSGVLRTKVDDRRYAEHRRRDGTA